MARKDEKEEEDEEKEEEKEQEREENKTKQKLRNKKELTGKLLSFPSFGDDFGGTTRYAMKIKLASAFYDDVFKSVL